MDDIGADIDAAHKRYGYVLEKLTELWEMQAITQKQYDEQREAALAERNVILDYLGVAHIE